MRKILIFLILVAFMNADVVIKNGFYAGIGPSVGYYNYNEYESRRNDAFVMRLDNMLVGVNSHVGYVAKGVKMQLGLDANAAFGLYTGGLFYDESRSTRVYGYAINSFYHADVILGYNILEPFGVESVSLFLQSGVSYFFGRTDNSGLERLQGYLSIPIALEGQVGLGESWSLDFMGGYNYFILGHHISRSTNYGMSGDVNVLQRNGYGAKAYLGLSHITKDDKKISMRLVYEHWFVDDSPLTTLYSYVTNEITRTYEPRNKSHIFTFQYIFAF